MFRISAKSEQVLNALTMFQKTKNTYDFDFGIEDEDAAFDEMEAE